MSANATAVRRLYEEGLFDSDPEAVLSMCAPDVVFVNPVDAVDAGVREGIEGARAALANVAGSFESPEHVLAEIHEHGEHVVALVVFRAFPREGAFSMEQREAHTWTFRDGKVVRFEWARDLAEALARVRPTNAADK